jgi:hypothetical protein
MNTQRPEGSASLPELTAQRIEEIEQALFTDIARERVERSRRERRRGRLWIAGGAAAAVVAVAAVIAPSVGSLVGAGGTSAVAPSEERGGADSGIALDAPTAPAPDDARSLTEGGATSESAAGDTADRDIITTASASITVDDVEVAARAVGDVAVAHGGYVESMTIDRDGAAPPVDPATGSAYDIMPYPYPPQGTSVTVRVPAEDLPSVVSELSEIGEVTSSSIGRQDVTDQTVDLQARIDAAQASVDRLTALMSQAQNVADLIAAESALSERQGLLESYEQQLEMLQDQVEMSSLTVSIAPRVTQVAADPAGFGDGLAAGWNGLIATLNGIVVAFGFLLPWLAVAAVAALIVWAVVRIARRRRGLRSDAAAAVDHTADGRD